MERAGQAPQLEVVRFAFADQHGVLRGKTLVASDAARAMRDGVAMTSTLLAKDTSHRNVFPVFGSRWRFRPRRDGRRRQFPDAAGPGHVPRAALGRQHRLAAVRHLLSERQAGAVLHAALHRGALQRLAAGGFDFSPASRSSSSCSSCSIRPACDRCADLPAEAPAVEHTTHGFQYLTEARFDQVDPILQIAAHATMQALGMPLRSLEVELGPSQCEFTFAPDAARGRPTPWCCSAAP